MREAMLLAARLAALERKIGAASGLGVSSAAAGALNFRTTQLGFAAELTSAWSDGTGYSWKRKRLDTTAPISLVDPGVQPTGDKAYEVSGDTSLAVGTQVWLEPSPDGVGYLFVKAGSGGADNCLGPAAGWQTADCLLFSVSAGAGRCKGVAPQSIPAAYNATEAAWVGADTLATDTATWQVLYDWPAADCCPRVRLRVFGGSGSAVPPGTVVTMRYIGCKDGKLEFASADPDLCGGTPATGTCADNTFRVDVTCSPCPTVAIPCLTCSPELPYQICLTFDAGSGGLAYYFGGKSYVLTAETPDSLGVRWSAVFTGPDMIGLAGCPVTFRIEAFPCQSPLGAWEVQVTPVSAPCWDANSGYPSCGTANYIGSGSSTSDLCLAADVTGTITATNTPFAGANCSGLWGPTPGNIGVTLSASTAGCGTGGGTNPPAPSYNCVAGTCTDPGDGTGTYATLAECVAAGCGVAAGDCCAATVTNGSTVTLTIPGVGTYTSVWAFVSGKPYVQFAVNTAPDVTIECTTDWGWRMFGGNATDQPSSAADCGPPYQITFPASYWTGATGDLTVTP